MRIKNLKIFDYRNIDSLDYQPGEGLNMIAGRNGQGKTNLIEAIFLLATGYSFRSGTYQNLIGINKTRFLLKSEYCYQGRNIESQLEYAAPKVTFTINNKKSSFRGSDHLRVVLFTPDDLYMVKGNPGKRRDFIDFVLRQISAEYQYNFDNYTKTLKKRNLLFKQEQTTTRTFGIVNQLFMEYAAHVILARINFVNLMDEIVNNLYKEVDNSLAEIKIKYAVSFPIDNDKISLDILYRSLEQIINSSQEQEKWRKTSLYGPHVDDLNIYHNGKLARYFSSQGQQRTIAVSMKLAQMYTFKRIEGYYPIFLLDEVLSELDDEKQLRLLDHLRQTEYQSFLTSVAAKPVEGANRVLIEKGCLRRE